MSAAPAAANTLQLIDAVIKQVEALPISEAKGSCTKGASSSSSSASSSSASLVPTETKDVRFWPIIPPGHTAYTFYGVTSENPSGVILAEHASASSAAAAAPKAAAPAAASSSSSAPASAPKGGDKKKDEKAAASSSSAKPAAAKPAKAQAAKADAPPAEDPNQPDYTKLDIRVGQIVKAARHPKPEVTSLYVEEIDVGEDKPRQIVSGLVNFIPLDVFEKSRVCVVCNLKPSSLQDVVSHGMVLAASTGAGADRKVELVQPPAGAKPGDRIVLLEGDDVSAFKPMAIIDSRKKNKAGEYDNAWARVAAKLKTNDSKQATWDGKLLGTKANGPAASSTLAGANIA